MTDRSAAYDAGPRGVVATDFRASASARTQTLLESSGSSLFYRAVLAERTRCEHGCRVDPWSALAEARIRDWQRRVERGETTRQTPVRLESLEGQLLKEILRLRLMAQQAPQDRARLMREAENLRIRLMTMLESDRPLLAQIINAKLAYLSRPDQDEP